MIDEEAALPPLHRALEEHDLESVRELLRFGSSYLEQTRDGLTPLMYAISDPERDVAIIELLIQAGADVEARDPDGDTPLHYNVDLVFGCEVAVAAPFVVARLLRGHGADVEARGAWGWTPLMKAAVQGDDEEFTALLEIGADFRVHFPADTQPEFLQGSELALQVFDAPEKLRALIHHGFDVRPEHVDACRSELADARLEARRTPTAEELDEEDALDAQVDAELEVWFGPEEDEGAPRDRAAEHRAFWREHAGLIEECLAILESAGRTRS